MTIDELIDLLRIVRPTRLSPLQEWVLRRSWEGTTYAEMVEERCYRVEYIRRSGAELWAFLSEYFDQAITKPHLREALERRPLTIAQQQLIERSPGIALPAECPSGPLPPNSPLYIPRSPLETLSLEHLAQPGSLIRIKAPMKMGKTSLLLRLLDHAQTQQMHTVALNLQQADSDVFCSSDRFLRWLCANMSRRLHLESRLEDYWDTALGSKMSCTYYLEEYILATLNRPLLLVLDELHRLFQYPKIAADFLPLLRFWHSEGTHSRWQQLRCVLSYSSEMEVPLDVQDSPLSVGLALELPPLQVEQVRSLALKFGLRLDHPTRLQHWVRLVGGLPYLVQLGLYHLQRGDVTLEKLLQQAATETGIYRQHLRQQWSSLQANPGLLPAYQRVIASQPGAPLETTTASLLESWGLVKLAGNIAMPSCDLYRLYFGRC